MHCHLLQLDCKLSELIWTLYKREEVQLRSPAFCPVISYYVDYKEKILTIFLIGY